METAEVKSLLKFRQLKALMRKGKNRPKCNFYTITTERGIFIVREREKESL